MLAYPHIKPIAIQIGSVKIYWYGIMYLLSFSLAWILAKSRAKKLNLQWPNETITDFIFYAAIGAVLGGRLGYVLLYDLSYFLHNPLFIFKTWLGGMSFHGGIIGVTISLFLFAKKNKLPFVTITDFAAPLAPLGLALGRIGNFLNAELYGRITNVSWGIVFPNAGTLPRHPSQLYEAFGEGIILFTALWIYSNKPKPPGKVSALFLLGYGVIRFICEFFREPDQQLGFIALDWLTMGQILSLPMIILGIVILILCRTKL